MYKYCNPRCACALRIAAWFRSRDRYSSSFRFFILVYIAASYTTRLTRSCSPLTMKRHVRKYVSIHCLLAKQFVFDSAYIKHKTACNVHLVPALNSVQQSLTYSPTLLVTQPYSEWVCNLVSCVNAYTDVSTVHSKCIMQ